MSFRMCSFRYRRKRDTIPGLRLCGCWFAGSSLGLLAECFCGDAIASWLTLLPGQIPDLGSVLLLSVLPLLLTASAVTLFRPCACYVLCLIRGFGQGLVIACLGRLFGSGTPIVVFLLLFSSLWTNPFILWYWCRCLRGNSCRFAADTVLCAVFCVLIGLLDHCAIAPFLADVINT